MSNITMQAWLVVWTLGAPVILAAISVFIDGTLDHSTRAVPGNRA